MVHQIFVEETARQTQLPDKSVDFSTIPLEIWHYLFQFLSFVDQHRFARTTKSNQQRVYSFWNSVTSKKLTKEVVEHFTRLNISAHHLYATIHYADGQQFLTQLYACFQQHNINSLANISDEFHQQHLQPLLVEAAWKGELPKLIILQQLGACLTASCKTTKEKCEKLMQANFGQARLLYRQASILHIIARQGHLKCLRFLLSLTLLKNTINQVDNTDMTALHYAAAECHLAVVQLLCENGASLTINSTAENQDHQGTALHIAAHHGTFELLEYLLQQGANPNQKTNTGQTPLHIACMSQLDAKFAIKLIEYGADKNIKDIYKKTPFDYLSKGKNNPNFSMLKNAKPIHSALKKIPFNWFNHLIHQAESPTSSGRQCPQVSLP